MSAQEAFWRSRKIGSKGELVWGAVGVTGGVALLVNGSPWGWALFAVGAILAIFVSARYLLHRRAYRESPAFSGLTAASFGEDHIQVVNPIGSSQLDWSLYQSAMENDAFFLPMISKRSFSIIPKRAFVSGADIDEFRALLESKLGSVVKIR